MWLFLKIIVSILILQLSACSAKKNSSGFEQDTQSKSFIVVKDGIGRTVKLIKPAMRIVSLSPGITEALFDIGCGKNVILRDKWSLFPDDVKQLPVTDSLNPSVDNISGYNPDLVILYFSDDRFVDIFSRVNIKVAVFNPQNYEQVAEDIEKLGLLCGKSDNAKILAGLMRKRRDKVIKKSAGLSAKTVYVEIDSSDGARPWTAGGGSLVDELLTMAGGVNVFREIHKPYVQVALEDVVRSEPDYVLMAGLTGRAGESIKRLLDRPGMNKMPAVTEGRVIYKIDKDLLTLTGPRLADGLEQLFNALHKREFKPEKLFN